jgi:hypothetical protein
MFFTEWAIIENERAFFTTIVPPKLHNCLFKVFSGGDPDIPWSNVCRTAPGTYLAEQHHQSPAAGNPPSPPCVRTAKGPYLIYIPSARNRENGIFFHAFGGSVPRRTVPGPGTVRWRVAPDDWKHSCEQRNSLRRNLESEFVAFSLGVFFYEYRR